MCHQAKAGKVRGRPITAPDLLIYHDMDASMRVSTLDPRPATVYETIGHIIRPLTRQSSVALSGESLEQIGYFRHVMVD